jgi:hypothetical protein
MGVGEAGVSGPMLPPWYAPDLPGQDLRPDPDAISTVAELLEAMRPDRP